MSLLDTHWTLCPVCRGKTRTQIREDTVLENFPLFCPKCRRTFLISMRGQKTEYLCQPDAKTQLTLTFDEIAALAGTALDHSFLTCKKELPAYGYAVGNISMKQQTVIFHKLPEGGSQ